AAQSGGVNLELDPVGHRGLAVAAGPGTAGRAGALAGIVGHGPGGAATTCGGQRAALVPGGSGGDPGGGRHGPGPGEHGLASAAPTTDPALPALGRLIAQYRGGTVARPCSARRPAPRDARP